MNRILVSLFLASSALLAGDLSSITSREASKGLKEALTQGVGQAVGKLSITDGFLGNPQVKIPLPPALAKAEKTLRQLGMDRHADELVTSMNRAAESAVTEAKPILLDGLKKMTLDDAKGILTGPPDSATQYFRRTSGEAIVQKFLPKVQAAMSKIKVAQDYDRFAKPAAQFGLIDKQDTNLEEYITRKAVDGLFFMIAEEEKAIRKDPIGQASKLLQKVFGALKL